MNPRSLLWLGVAAGVLLGAGVTAFALDDGARSTPVPPAVRAEGAATAQRTADAAIEPALVDPKIGGPITLECYLGWKPDPPPGQALPPRAQLDAFTSARYADPKNEDAARAAVAAVTGQPAGRVECAAPIATLADDGGEAPRAEAAPAAPTVATESGKVAADTAVATDQIMPAPAPEASGSCWVEGRVTRPADLSDDIALSQSVSGVYYAQADEPAMRAIIAELGGVPADQPECNFYIPPAGNCYVQLAPRAGDPAVPPGARLDGYVGGEYLEPQDEAALRAAVAAMARVEPAQVTCDRF